MLVHLENLLQTNGLIEKAPIKDLPNSCCSSSIVVIDFDRFKEKLLKLRPNLHERNPPKSADALLLDEHKNRILFIEMKDIQDMPDSQEEFERKILQFRLDKKMLDSLGVLLKAAQEFNAKAILFPYLLSDSCDIRFYFLWGKGSARDFLRKYFLTQVRTKYKFEYFLFDKVRHIYANNFPTNLVDL